MKFPYYIFIFVISKTVRGYVSRCGFSGKHCLGIIFIFVAGVKEGLNIPAWCMHLMASFLQNKPQPFKIYSAGECLQSFPHLPKYCLNNHSMKNDGKTSPSPKLTASPWKVTFPNRKVIFKTTSFQWPCWTSGGVKSMFLQSRWQSSGPTKVWRPGLYSSDPTPAKVVQPRATRCGSQHGRTERWYFWVWWANDISFTKNTGPWRSFGSSHKKILSKKQAWKTKRLNNWQLSSVRFVWDVWMSLLIDEVYWGYNSYTNPFWS